MSDLALMWGVIWEFPWHVKLLLISPLLAVAFVFWMIEKTSTIDHQWYDKWRKEIDRQSRHVSMRVKRKDREQAYRYVFGQLWNQLHNEIGYDFNKMTTIQRGIYIYLATAHRNHMRAYE